MVERWGRHGWFLSCSTYEKKKKDSCTFTKEKPDKEVMADEEQGEEYCEECGQPMVLKRGRFGQFMACTGYPNCRTVRKIGQPKQSKPVELDEVCPQCNKHKLVEREGQYGKFVACSGYPKCKYVKQNLVPGMKCPKCGEGDIAERRARKGNTFYGCTNYPKCDFTSNHKPVPEPCPECGSPYLLEKTLKSGVYLTCPNNKKQAEEEKPKRKKKGAAAEEETATAVKCDFQKRIGDAPEREEPPAQSADQEAAS
jgi:DNA topoisomerase-1